MRAVTIKEAKAHLNELVEAACRGEQVVLLRGSEHVAAIVPISAADLELRMALSDVQAEKLWALAASERSAGKLATFGSSEEVVLHLADSGRRSTTKPKVKAKSRRGAKSR
jgi:prevent-host-death family protein